MTFTIYRVDPSARTGEASSFQTESIVEAGNVLRRWFALGLRVAKARSTRSSQTIVVKRSEDADRALAGLLPS